MGPLLRRLWRRGAADRSRSSGEQAYAPTAEERQAELADGLLRFGASFLPMIGSTAPELFRETLQLMLAWLGGERLSDRADEDERRARAALELLEMPDVDDPAVRMLAAVALLELPAGHEARLEGLAGEVLRECLQHYRAEGLADETLETISALLRHDLEPPETSTELVEEGLSLRGKADDTRARRHFLVDGLLHYQRRAREASDAHDDDETTAWVAEADSLAELLLEDVRESGVGEEDEDAAHWLGLASVVAASQFYHRDRWREAVELYQRAVDLVGVVDPAGRIPAERVGELRLRLGEYEAAVEVLEPLVPLAEEDYLTAVLPEEIAEAGTTFSNAALSLSLAQARLGRLDAAFRSLDAVKSRRLRYAAAVRSSPNARRLLELEASLDLVSRGVRPEEPVLEDDADPLGAELSARARLLEEYRRARPRLAPELLASPSARAVSDALAPGEALIALGLHATATVALAVTGGRAAPHEPLLDEDWTLDRWTEAFSGEEGSGWLLALADPELPGDRSAILDDFLQLVDEGLGVRLRAMLDESVRRVTIVPHALLHLVPFWALPSLSGLDVLVAPSAAQVVEARSRPVETLGDTALVVSNPTLDLPLSPAEEAAVARHLGRRGTAVATVAREAATEDGVRAALPQASLLHFSGHGRSSWLDPTRSALFVNPGPMTGDPFVDLLAGAEEAGHEWEAVGDEDESDSRLDIPGLGQLVATRRFFSDRLELRLERAEGTLWGLYEEEQLVQLAELWSAADIMLEHELVGCRLAVLSACESGLAGGRAVDEYVGLPAALGLAGVGTVVCTLWPVSEGVAALFSDLLYAGLAASEGEVDLARVVRAACGRLRTLERGEARALLAELRAHTRDPRAAFGLEAFSASLEERGERPFSTAWDWAAFHLVGRGQLRLKEVSP